MQSVGLPIIYLQTVKIWSATFRSANFRSAIFRIFHFLVAVWLSGNIIGRINEVTLRRAGLVLRWVTVRGYTVLVSNQASQAHSAWPSLRG